MTRNSVLYHQRRNEWLTANGPCQNCGSQEKLEVDHRDPAQTLICGAHLWLSSKSRRERELAKCQVLCRSCHKAKHRELKQNKNRELAKALAVSRAKRNVLTPTAQAYARSA